MKIAAIKSAITGILTADAWKERCSQLAAADIAIGFARSASLIVFCAFMLAIVTGVAGTVWNLSLHKARRDLIQSKARVGYTFV
jgi:hypothetical protein